VRIHGGESLNSVFHPSGQILLGEGSPRKGVRTNETTFRCTDPPVQDPANPGALSRKMMQKIVNVEYSYPPNIQLSPEVKELLSRIFTKDPTTRIKVPEMTHHPW